MYKNYQYSEKEEEEEEEAITEFVNSFILMNGSKNIAIKTSLLGIDDYNNNNNNNNNMDNSILKQSMTKTNSMAPSLSSGQTSVASESPTPTVKMREEDGDDNNYNSKNINSESIVNSIIDTPDLNKSFTPQRRIARPSFSNYAMDYDALNHSINNIPGNISDLNEDMSIPMMHNNSINNMIDINTPVICSTTPSNNNTEATTICGIDEINESYGSDNNDLVLNNQNVNDFILKLEENNEIMGNVKDSKNQNDICYTVVKDFDNNEAYYNDSKKTRLRAKSAQYLSTYGDHRFSILNNNSNNHTWKSETRKRFSSGNNQKSSKFNLQYNGINNDNLNEDLYQDYNFNRKRHQSLQEINDLKSLAKEFTKLGKYNSFSDIIPLNQIQTQNIDINNNNVIDLNNINQIHDKENGLTLETNDDTSNLSNRRILLHSNGDIITEMAINLINSNNYPLHEACKIGDLVLVNRIISMDKLLNVQSSTSSSKTSTNDNIELIDSMDDKGNTPLRLAVLSGSLPIVLLLLDKGCKIPKETEFAYDKTSIIAMKNKLNEMKIKMKQINKNNDEVKDTKINANYNNVVNVEDIRFLLAQFKLCRGVDANDLTSRLLELKQLQDLEEEIKHKQEINKIDEELENEYNEEKILNKFNENNYIRKNENMKIDIKEEEIKSENNEEEDLNIETMIAQVEQLVNILSIDELA